MKTYWLGLLFVLVFLPGIGSTRPLGEQTRYIRWATHRYPLHHPFFTAILRYEDGRKGSEAGLNPVLKFTYGSLTSDPQSYADPTMPDGALQHSRLARRIIMHTQDFVLEDTWRRGEFFKVLVKKYGYDANTLKRVFFEEREQVKIRANKGNFNPWLDDVNPPSQPLDIQKILVRWTVYRYRVREELLSAMFQLEVGQNGSSGLAALKSFSLQASPQDPQGMLDLMPEGALAYSRIAWKMSANVQSWIFDDEWMRGVFFKWWARKYLAGGRVAKNDAEREEANMGYAKMMAKIYGMEQAAWKRGDRG